MESRSFCTYFDHNYIARGLTLHGSIKQHCPSFRLYVLCLSSECRIILEKVMPENVILISTEELEQFEPRLLVAKKNRSVIEYYFTLSPILPLFILKNFPDEKHITYLDSDTYLFNSPEKIFEEIGGGSVAIVEHRFPVRLKHREIYGKYNVGWLTFANNINGHKCLEWYSEKCLEWCYDRVEEIRYADQKYLDYFVNIVDDVIKIKNIGCNLAPWNVDKCSISVNVTGEVHVNEEKLVLYHFEGLKKISDKKFNTGLYEYKTVMHNSLKKMVYLPYLKALVENIVFTQSIIPSVEMRSLRYAEIKRNRVIDSLKKHYNYLKLHYLMWKYNTLVCVDRRYVPVIEWKITHF